MFYHLTECEVNLTTFVVAAQVEKNYNHTLCQKQRLKEVEQPIQYCK